MTKVSNEHQSAAALEAEAKKCASRFVREERHINSLQRKLQHLVEQQKSVINASKVCCHVLSYRFRLSGVCATYDMRLVVLVFYLGVL